MRNSFGGTKTISYSEKKRKEEEKKKGGGGEGRGAERRGGIEFPRTVMRTHKVQQIHCRIKTVMTVFHVSKHLLFY